MKIPISWLKNYVSIQPSFKKLADKLTSIGTKVEKIHSHNNQTTFEFEITPNRPDCLSVIGLAREISALQKTKLKLPSITQPKYTGKNKSINIQITKPDLCQAYTAASISINQPKPSPNFIQNRLKLAGIRTINNIVDITNYVMLESGIPLHAFDLDQFQSNKLIIRQAKKNEKTTLLDNQTHQLPTEAIVVEESNRIVDLACLMGGQNTEVTSKTSKIYLWSILCNPLAIRKTSKFLKLRTEASLRMEKGLDLQGTHFAFYRTLNLLQKYANAKLISPIDSRQPLAKTTTISLSNQQFTKLTGIEISSTQAIDYLNRLEIKTKSSNNNSRTSPSKWQLTTTPPSFRRDLNISEDLIEEIIRLYGYNNLPLTLPQGEIPQKSSPQLDSLHPIKLSLTQHGFSEIFTSTLIPEQKDTLKVLHPMSKDYYSLRPSLLPAFKKGIQLNQPHFNRISLFEIGTIFLKNKNKNQLPHQPLHLGLISNQFSLEQLEYLTSIILKNLGYKYKKSYLKAQQPLHNNFNYLEINLDEIIPQTPSIQYTKVSKYSPVIIDLTFTSSQSWTELKPKIKKTAQHLKKIQLLNIYKNKLNLRLIFLSTKKQLTQDFANKQRTKIIKAFNLRLA